MLKGLVRLLGRGERKRRAADLPEWQRAIRDRVAPCTMTSDERIYALVNAVTYLAQHEIPGAIVECGVWRGGSMMAVAHALQHLGITDRELYLFDTFEGMTTPGQRDVDFAGTPALGEYREKRALGAGQRWAEAGLAEVQANLASTGYPSERIHYIAGAVEQTLPAAAPERIALLRLDTDWYESTMHELVHLYPRVSRHGVVVIDDYGHWRGAREAVDEYLARERVPCLLHRIDYTGREFVKLQERD